MLVNALKYFKIAPTARQPSTQSIMSMVSRDTIYCGQNQFTIEYGNNYEPH